MGGSQTANKNLAADAVAVRAPKAARSDTDIVLGTAFGGAPGAAGAVAVRGARYGLGVIGRRSDIARNDQLAAAIVQDNPQALLEGIRRRMAGRVEMSPERQEALARVTAALLGSSDRNSDNRNRALCYVTGR